MCENSEKTGSKKHFATKEQTARKFTKLWFMLGNCESAQTKLMLKTPAQQRAIYATLDYIKAKGNSILNANSNNNDFYKQKQKMKTSKLKTSKRTTTATSKRKAMKPTKRNTTKTPAQFNRVNVDLNQNFVIIQDGVPILTHRGHLVDCYHAVIHIKRGDVVNMAYSEEIVEFLGFDDMDTVDFGNDPTPTDYANALSLKEAKRIYPDVSFTPDAKNKGKVIDKVKVYYNDAFLNEIYTLLYSDGTKSLQEGRPGDYADLINQYRHPTAE